MPRPDDIYEKITQRIIADLRDGTPTWRRPWATAGGGAIPLRHNGVPYQGVNILLLWSAAIDRGYVSPHWMTYRQAQELGGQVRRGERASHVFFAKTVKKRADGSEGGPASEDDAEVLHVRRAYAVFNVDQIDGLPEKYRVEIPDVNPGERLERCEAWFAALGVDIRHGGERAFYSPADDYIRMPPFAAFRSPEAYYAVLAHECVHLSGAKHRLGRDMFKRDEASVAREELVAELGSAFLCADLGLSPEPREDHAPYIASWLKALDGDPRAVATAATRAQRAVDFLHGMRDAERAEAA